MNDEKNIDWEDFLKTVKPLKRNKNEPFYNNKKKILNDVMDDDNSLLKTNLSDLDVLSDKKINNLEIDKNLLNKIHKGKIKINSILDLHGFKLNESREKVFNFIHKNFEKKKKLVLIITGKGKRLGVEDGWRGDGVLKTVIPKWLNSVVLSKYIVWFDHAPRNKGGEGAILVYLKSTIK